MRLDLSRARIGHLVLLGVLVVFTLGLVREAYVLAFGLDTPLRDLRQISLNAEQNLASWYTSLLMAAGALLAWLAACCAATESARARRFWRLATVLLLLCAVDETVSFHEVLTLFLPGVAAASPFLHFAWVVAILPLLAVLGLWCLWLMWPLPASVRSGLLAAAFVFLTGAVALEVLDGAILERVGEESLAYRTGYVLEDTLEMLGVAIFINVVLRHIETRAARIEFTLARATYAN
jgi:hypothetical protein